MIRRAAAIGTHRDRAQARIQAWVVALLGGVRPSLGPRRAYLYLRESPDATSAATRVRDAVRLGLREPRREP